MIGIFDLSSLNFIQVMIFLLRNLFIWGNFLLAILFFGLGNHLISLTKKFEINQKSIKIQIKKVEKRSKFGIYILALFSLLSLFSIFQSTLKLCFIYLPSSPILDLLNSIEVLDTEGDFDSPHLINIKEISEMSYINQLIVYSISTVAFFSFIIAIINMYFLVFNKLTLGIKKPKSIVYLIIAGVLLVICGFPLMLELIMN